MSSLIRLIRRILYRQHYDKRDEGKVWLYVFIGLIIITVLVLLFG